MGNNTSTQQRSDDLYNPKTYGQAIQENIGPALNILAQLIKAGGGVSGPMESPITHGVSGAVQGAWNAPVGSNVMAGASEGANKGILSPFQEGVKKALRTKGETFAGSAIDQAEDPLAMAKHIEEQSGLSPNSIQTTSGSGVRQNGPYSVNEALSSLSQMAQQGNNTQSNSSSNPPTPPTPPDNTVSALSQMAEQRTPVINPASSTFSPGGISPNGDINQPGNTMQVLQAIFPKFFPQQANAKEMLSQQNLSLSNQALTQKLQGTEKYQQGEKERDQALYDSQLAVKKSESLASINNKLLESGQHYGDEFTKATTEYPKQFQAYANLQSMLNAPYDPKSVGATDFATAYEFVKFNDPNAVKEGERYDVRKIAPLLQRSLQSVQFKGPAFTGATLTPGARKAIQKAIILKKKSLDRGYNSFVKAYSEPLKARGLDPKDFLVGASLNEATNYEGAKKSEVSQASTNQVGKYTYS